MDIAKYMDKHGLTDDLLDTIAAPYEDASYIEEQGQVYTGSHVDAVGKKRVTVIYDASAAQQVVALARARGVRPSAIYRDALDSYLAAQQ